MGSYIGEKQTLKTTKHCMGAMNLNVTKMLGCPCLEKCKRFLFLGKLFSLIAIRNEWSLSHKLL